MSIEEEIGPVFFVYFFIAYLLMLLACHGVNHCCQWLRDNQDPRIIAIRCFCYYWYRGLLLPFIFCALVVLCGLLLALSILVVLVIMLMGIVFLTVAILTLPPVLVCMFCYGVFLVCRYLWARFRYQT